MPPARAPAATPEADVIPPSIRNLSNHVLSSCYLCGPLLLLFEDMKLRSVIVFGGLFLFGSCALQAEPWETISDCRLIENRYLDGDSFHVQAKNQDQVFRLYAVDAPETDDKFPERVNEQKKYFSTTKKAILAGGQEAAEFTRKLLQDPFTVETKWVDAKGNSQQPRFFAKVTLADGSDLGMRLIEAGLARSYGMREDVLLSYLNHLDKAQTAAQESGIGLWSAKAKRAATKAAKKSDAAN